jgi:hypothetical protein
MPNGAEYWPAEFTELCETRLLDAGEGFIDAL